MNNIIFELAEQVLPNDREFFKCSREYIGYVFDKDELATFAKLIIDRILELIEPMPGSGNIEDLCLAEMQEQIKEHFGIEE